jgi:cellobiose phosphorylase
MFDSYQHIRAGDCHGDIYYWVMIALANYIKTTGDTSILAEKVPYFKEANHTTVQEHIDRLTQMIVDSYINGNCFGAIWRRRLE